MKLLYTILFLVIYLVPTIVCHIFLNKPIDSKHYFFLQSGAQCLTDQYPPKPERVLPTYVINLDSPPIERWQNVAAKYSAEVRFIYI